MLAKEDRKGGEERQKRRGIEEGRRGGNDTRPVVDQTAECEERTTYFVATDAVLGFLHRCHW